MHYRAPTISSLSRTREQVTLSKHDNASRRYHSPHVHTTINEVTLVMEQIEGESALLQYAEPSSQASCLVRQGRVPPVPIEQTADQGRIRENI